MASEQHPESPGTRDTQEWVEPLPEKVPEATFAPAFLALGITFLALRNSKFICIFCRRPGADGLVDQQVDRRARAGR